MSFPAKNLSTVAHNPQQHQEQVYEIEIEGEGADDGAFAHHAGIQARGLGQGHVFKPLGVVDGQTGEKQDADVADDHRHPRTLEEKVDHRGDDDADKAHEQETAKRGQVFLGRPAVNACGHEGAGADEESRGDRRLGVGQKYCR